MYELLLEFFKANQTQFYGGQTAKGLARDLTKLCRTSETAHKLVCCWMAKLCAEPSLFDMAVSGEVPYEIVRPFAFSKSEIPETLGNMIKLPLQGGYRVNKVNLCTGEITHNEADRCSVIDHEFDHYIDFLSDFFGGYLKDHKDLTLERIVPQIHEVVPDPLVFSKKMKDNPVFFNSVCEFFDEYWQLDESTNEFQKRILQKALDHFNDWSSRSQSTWLSEDEVWVMVGLKLAQRLNEQPMLFINSMSDTAQAFELGLELPLFTSHSILNPLLIGLKSRRIISCTGLSLICLGSTSVSTSTTFIETLRNRHRCTLFQVLFSPIASQQGAMLMLSTLS